MAPTKKNWTAIIIALILTAVERKNNEHDTMGKLCHIYAYLPVCSSNIGRLEEE